MSMGGAHLPSALRQAIQQRVVSAAFGKGKRNVTPFNKMGQAGASSTANARRVAVPQDRVDQVFSGIGLADIQDGQHILNCAAYVSDELGWAVLVRNEEALHIASAGAGHELRDEGVGLEHGVCFLKVP